MRQRHWRTWIGVLAAAALACAGCSLADYERRMDENLARMREFDEQEKYLGPPLALPGPPTPEDPLPPISLQFVFLRPPQEISSTLKPGEEPYGKPPFLYRYPGKVDNPDDPAKNQYNLFLGTDVLPVAPPAPPAQPGQPAPPAPPAPAPAKEGEDKDFSERIKTALQHFYVNYYKQKSIPQFNETALDKAIEIKPFQLGADPVKPLRFDVVYYDTPEKTTPQVRFARYLHKREKASIVVVYQMPLDKANDPTWQKSIEVSLRTFEMERAGEKRRMAYQKARQGR